VSVAATVVAGIIILLAGMGIGAYAVMRALAQKDKPRGLRYRVVEKESRDSRPQRVAS